MNTIEARWNYFVCKNTAGLGNLYFIFTSLLNDTRAIASNYFM